ncbi:MAG: RICIN domain-containing protein [Chitinivibrionales bacterium]
MKKLVVLLVLVCATLSFGAFPDPNTWYKICNLRGGKYLQPANPVKSPGVNGVNIVQNSVDASCYKSFTNQTPYQEWKFVQVTGSSGYYYIQNKYTNLYIRS